LTQRRSWHYDGMDLSIPLPVIGIVHTSYAELEATPIQAGLNRAEHGTIDIADRYQDGLDGLAEFDYAWLMTWLHRLAGLVVTHRSGTFRSCCEASSAPRAYSPPGGQNGSTPSGSALSRSST
jgi:hypothetical protein